MPAITALKPDIRLIRFDVAIGPCVLIGVASKPDKSTLLFGIVKLN